MCVGMFACMYVHMHACNSFFLSLVELLHAGLWVGYAESGRAGEVGQRDISWAAGIITNSNVRARAQFALLRCHGTVREENLTRQYPAS